METSEIENTQFAEAPDSTILQTKDIKPAFDDYNRQQERTPGGQGLSENDETLNHKLTPKERLILNALKSQGHTVDSNHSQKHTIKHS